MAAEVKTYTQWRGAVLFVIHKLERQEEAGEPLSPIEKDRKEAFQQLYRLSKYCDDAMTLDNWISRNTKGLSGTEKAAVRSPRCKKAVALLHSVAQEEAAALEDTSEDVKKSEDAIPQETTAEKLKRLGAEFRYRHGMK